MELLVFIGIGVGIYLFFWISGKFDTASLYDELKPRLDRLDAYKQELDKRASEQENRDRALDKKEEEVRLLAQQKAIGFPWLAEAYADFFHLEDQQIAHRLKTKIRPARQAAEAVREAGRRRRDAERKARLLEYLIKYYETLFPWLEDLKSEEVEDELIRVGTDSVNQEEDEGAAQHWLTPEEYRLLPNSEKYDLALERYWTRKKTKWVIGRDYERYIGYLYEKDGDTVQYQGIMEGFGDLGRDLIVKRQHATQIVQCKNWSRKKTIHEKHIFQLFGTLIAYRFDHPSEEVRATFVTSTLLSTRAKGFAKLLDVEVREGIPLVRYPCVKCNISKHTGEKIYHLPFDQQYDRTIIEADIEEYYVGTVKEAESLGFRRAFRHRGPMD